MKVRVTLDVSEADRYLIATYYREAGLTSVVQTFGGRRGGKTIAMRSAKRDLLRTRATRAQVKRFAAGALRLCLNERYAALGGRTKTSANRLREDENPSRVPAVVPPSERDRSLFG